MMILIISPLKEGLYEMIISSFGQLGLWAPSSEGRDVSTSMAYVFTSPRYGQEAPVMCRHTKDV
jgi:hypothetical protein